jgi:hypothetical protein
MQHVELAAAQHLLKTLLFRQIVHNYGLNCSVYALVKFGVRSPKFIWAPMYSCTQWLRPRNFPLLPTFGLKYEGAIGQPI